MLITSWLLRTKLAHRFQSQQLKARLWQCAAVDKSKKPNDNFKLAVAKWTALSKEEKEEYRDAKMKEIAEANAAAAAAAAAGDKHD